VDAGAAGGYTKCSGIKVVGAVPSGYPTPAVPSPVGASWGTLFVDACSITIVVLAEHVSTTKLYATMHNYEVDNNSELVMIGLVNILSGCCSCFTVGCRFSGSAVNNKVGATSQVSLLVSGLFGLLLLPLISKALFFLPKTVLSVVVIFAVTGVVDLNAWPRTWRLSKRDFGVMAIAFVATLLLGVLVGLLFAIGVSVVVHILNSASPRIVELGRAVRTVDYQPLDPDDPAVLAVPRAKLLRFEAPLFFANVQGLTARLSLELRQNSVENLSKKAQWRALALDMACVAWIDSTAADKLIEAAALCRAAGYPLVLANCGAGPRRVLKAAGLHDVVPPQHVFLAVHAAARAIVLGEVLLSAPAAGAPGPSAVLVDGGDGEGAAVAGKVEGEGEEAEGEEGEVAGARGEGEFKAEVAAGEAARIGLKIPPLLASPSHQKKKGRPGPEEAGSVQRP
jgi:MFS superfamily sulfate permease-like transporter